MWPEVALFENQLLVVAINQSTKHLLKAIYFVIERICATRSKGIVQEMDM